MADRLSPLKTIVMLKISRTPAVTPAGIAAKLKMADRVEHFVDVAAEDNPDSPEVPNKMLTAALRDAERLAGVELP